MISEQQHDAAPQDCGTLSQEDRRKWERFATQVSDPYEVGVLLGGRQMYTARVVDESFGGLGFLIPSYAAMRVGQRILIYFRNQSQHAVVRRVEITDNGQFRVGIEFQRASWEALK